MPLVTLLFIVLVPAVVGAHGATLPEWHVSRWDVAAVALLVAGGLGYAVGSLRLARRGAHVRSAERASFWIGWTALMAAVAPPLDRAATLTFSAHMAQHELLMLVGGPLLIVGRPIVPWLWALPLPARLQASVGLQHRAPTWLWRTATTPVVAWGLHGVAVWVWHLPAVYEAAVGSEPIHALQHATFIATSALFWWGLVYGRYGRAAYGASALYVFTTMTHTGVLGALFALSTAPFYQVYADRAAVLGIDAARDQQLAGLVMWIPAGVVLMVFGLALVVAWVAESDRRLATPKREART
jgi:putative membrane protein